MLHWVCAHHGYIHHNYDLITTSIIQNNGKYISWLHLSSIYNKCTARSGLSLLPKLKLEHIRLNSYSRMRVYLAVQVCIINLMYMCEVWLSDAILCRCWVQVWPMLLHTTMILPPVKPRSFVACLTVFLTVWTWEHTLKGQRSANQICCHTEQRVIHGSR